MIARALTLGVAMLLGLGVPARAEPFTALPPYTAAYQPQGVDEIGLWRKMDEEESVLAQSDMVIRDEALNAYVRKVLCDTVGQDRCGSVRIYIIRTPLVNASMTPNGVMRIYSGFLLRMQSEAQLAMMLGHEFGHFETRHGLTKFKALRSGTDTLAWALVLANLSPSYDSLRTFRNTEMAIYGNLFRYGRETEREADRLAIAYLNASTMRPQEAAQVWRNLMREAEASALAKGLKKPRFDSIAFTASHPPEAERETYLTQMALADAAGRDDGAARYRAAMTPWMAQFLDDQIKLNDFGASEYLIQTLAQDGWTAPLHHARGELYRMRGNPRDLVNAAQFYAEAIALDPALAEAHRGLGLSLLKTGQPGPGHAALRTYMTLKPDAPDARLIGMMIPANGARP